MKMEIFIKRQTLLTTSLGQPIGMFFLPRKSSQEKHGGNLCGPAQSSLFSLFLRIPFMAGNISEALFAGKLQQQHSCGYSVRLNNVLQALCVWGFALRILNGVQISYEKGKSKGEISSQNIFLNPTCQIDKEISSKGDGYQMMFGNGPIYNPILVKLLYFFTKK